MSKYTNAFHTLYIKLCIQHYEYHLVLKHCSNIHKCIEIEMKFLDISLFGATYHYVVNIENKFHHDIENKFQLKCKK
jgi:hypothetical protein